MRLVLRRKVDAVVLQGLPFLALVQRVLVDPPLVLVLAVVGRVAVVVFVLALALVLGRVAVFLHLDLGLGRLFGRRGLGVRLLFPFRRLGSLFDGLFGRVAVVRVAV